MKVGSIAIALLVAACSLTAIPDLTSGTGDRDAGGDASPDAPSAAFCASQAPAPALCDDFEGPDLSRWSEVHAWDGAYGVRLDAHALLSEVDPAAPDCAYATVARTFPGAFRSTHLAYAVTAESGALGERDVLSVQAFGGGNDLCQLIVARGTDALVVTEQIVRTGAPNDEASHTTSIPLPTGRAVRVAIDHDLAGNRLALSIDGQPALAIAPTKACTNVPGPATVTLGLFCAAKGTTSRKVRFDDVTFDAK